MKSELNIVIELLSILSIATKEVKRPQASKLDVSVKYASCFGRSHVSSELFSRKLLGRTDIEDALKRLDHPIYDFQAVTALSLGTNNITAFAHPPNRPNEAMQQISNDMVQVKRDVVEVLKPDTEGVKCL